MGVIALPGLWMPPKREFVKPSFNFIRNLMSPLGVMGPNNPLYQVQVNGSSPPVVEETNTSTLTTASFLPPAGSLIIAIAQTGDPNANGNSGHTISDSLSGSWTQDSANGSTNYVGVIGLVTVHRRTTTVTNTSLTVSLAPSGTDPAGNQLTVLVLTGQAASPKGTTAVATSSTVANLSITPSAIGSMIVGGLIVVHTDPALTGPETGITAIGNYQDATNGATYGSARTSTATGSSLSAVTFGWTNTGLTAFAVAMVAVEYKPV